MPTDQVETSTKKDGLIFIKEVAKYFMDFLETDFHKRKNPKRSIKTRNADNLLIGINLSKYPTLTRDTWNLVNHSFDNKLLSKIGKGVYRTNIPTNLLDLIKLQIEKVPSTKINEVVNQIAEETEKLSVLYKQEYDKALTLSLENAEMILKKEIVLPFVNSVEKTVENLEIGDEEDVFLMEEELTEVLLKLFENKLSEILKGLITGEKVNIQKQLKTVFTFDDLKNCVRNFFENFQVGDLFSEMFEIDRNKAILDKQELYLYFCDITFNKVKYPIFYIPLSTKIEKDTLEITFDSQIYINKKALEFVVQEFNVQKGTRGNLKSVTDRIIYISQHENDLIDYLSSILSEICNFFELDKGINLTDNKAQVARSLFMRVSNSLHISLFDKSDESLVNDYEEILQQLNAADGDLAKLFNTLIEDFISKNPISVNPEVEKEWDDSEISEKLVSISPIPLNSEQLQILSAIKKDNCKYTIVEGPPGTGKSHTITAIIFNAILRHQAVLVLSDKKEALDVVEEKITDTMNKVRFGEEEFQNPILRLGKIGGTYSQILAKPTLEKIKTQHKAVKKDEKALEAGILELQSSLKTDVANEISSYSEVEMDEIQAFYDLDAYYEKNSIEFDVDELTINDDAIQYLDEVRGCLFFLKNNFAKNPVSKLLEINIDKIHSVELLKAILNDALTAVETIKMVSGKFGSNLLSILDFPDFAEKDLLILKQTIEKYKKAKSPILGYLFKKSVLKEIDLEFRKLFPLSQHSEPFKSITRINQAIEIFDYLASLKPSSGHFNRFGNDFFTVFSTLFKVNSEFESFISFVSEVRNSVGLIEQGFVLTPDNFKKLGLISDNLDSWLENKLVLMSDLDFDRAMEFVGLKKLLENRFGQIPQINYSARKKEIELLVTAQVTHLLDSRLINFYNNNKSDAETLRTVIREKKRFPKEQFAKLRDAFPCILAGIRDYAEYIPLEPEIFDLVIIDEASQVSIAQAFPALIRAKKVLILGDRKQFSNVKSAQARSETNREYLNTLAKNFKENVSDEDSKLVKLTKFDIKTSILEFFEFISNYNIQLLKHFRGYKEIISYSNKYFYQDSLQVMKIRGKNIDEVIKFTVLENDEKIELTQNTNKQEINEVIKELKILREGGSKASVGIITPHTNQQKLLMEEISRLPERDYYFDQLKLKIMTFDTCQGEERDIIFYSMVANEYSDRLWGVFLKDFNNADGEEEGRIKVQRLNVGFSRAKERVHFIVSKPLDSFSGSIGDALRHYYNVLEEAKKEKSTADVDQKSKMEPAVLNWFYQTNFWKKYKNQIEFIPQFEIGKYLKQLDKTYQHPNYKVDFLLIYKDEFHNENKIIIEYDGFKEHFGESEGVNEFNYKSYYSKDDVYRQKVLESYGYKFLRINRFNIGVDPISSLNERIEELLKKEPLNNNFLDGIYETIEGLQNGNKKECPKCKEIRDLNDFKDYKLARGYGRICKSCKSEKHYSYVPKPPASLVNINCPRCNSKMVLRTGSRGKFYGCSRFPHCRGTRQC